jgi:hypothetical protein
MMAHLAKEPSADPSFESVRRSMAHGTIIASFTIETFSLDRLAAITPADVQSRYNDYAAMIRLT